MIGAGMRGNGTSIAVLAGMVGLTSSSANAALSGCKSIAAPMERLACYDKANAAAPSRKPSAIKPVLNTAYATPAPLPIKGEPPVKSNPRFWFEAEGGIYGFSRNLPVLAGTAAPLTTGPTHLPSSPGFIGLFTTSTVTNPLVTGTPVRSGGGGSFRMGYWLDPAQTMAVDGSIFFVQGDSSFGLSQTPTSVITTTSINTTPAVFVHLYDDVTTTWLTKGAISDQLYGADLNFRIRAGSSPELPKFDVMAGLRYLALDEKLTASVNSVFSRTFDPALGLPQPTDLTGASSSSATFRIRNDFIGPQIGFNAEQHWGRFWVANESKVAVGAMIERLWVSGSTTLGVTPTTGIALAGIPLAVNAGQGAGVGAPLLAVTTGAPTAFGLFAQGNRSRTVFAVVPSGAIKGGYDITPNMSLTVAYNYLYMNAAGRIGDQIASPSDIRQSSVFLQGITFGVKTLF